MSKNILLKLDNLNLQIERKIILNKITASFEEGKSYVLMGPNGSGKSSLAKTIMGYPTYQPQSGSISFQDQEITSLTTDQRARLGIFLSAQSPPEFDGIRVSDLLRTALTKKKSWLKIKKEVDQFSQELQLPKDLLNKPLNQNASGGERKKLELLQAAVLNPILIILDEIDTGVDVDSLKTISQFIKNHFLKPTKTLLLITHYQRILQYLTVDQVLVMKEGQIVKTGDYELAATIDKEGYTWL